MLQSVTIPFKNKSREAAAGRARNIYPAQLDHSTGMNVLQRGQRQLPKVRARERNEAEDGPIPEAAADIAVCPAPRFDAQNISPAAWPTFPALEDAFLPEFPKKIPPGLSNSVIHPFSTREGRSTVVRFSRMRFGCWLRHPAHCRIWAKLTQASIKWKV